MPVRIKFCGITRVEDALLAAELGVDALGFVFAPSPRRVTPAAAAAMIERLPPFVSTVGLVVDEDPSPILAVCPVDFIQFHGSEAPAAVEPYGRRAIKAVRVQSAADLPGLSLYRGIGGFLLDAYVPGVAGGTGIPFRWELAAGLPAGGPPVVIAGGLSPENVRECLEVTRPYGVDVSSGIESSPGVKDAGRMRAFVQAVRSWDGR